MPIPNSLPWTGDYLDGLGNRISLWAYANPKNRQDPKQRADGYGLVRFKKSAGTATFECWPRFATAETQQFEGWPITINLGDNDGRKVTHWLQPLSFELENPVVQVIAESSGEVLYTRRV